MSLTLYRLEGCPFCEMIVDDLDDLGLDYESVWVEALHSERNEVKEVTGQREVPVLIDEETGAVLHQSRNIREYLEKSYSS